MLTRSTAIVLGLFLFTGFAAACSSSGGGNDNPNGGDGGPGMDAGFDVNDPDAQIPDGPDVPPGAFPTEPPQLFGYALQDAFPGTFLSGAMDMAWPKGSNQPFVLQRSGYIVRLHGDGTREENLNFESDVAFDAEAGALGMALHPKFGDGTNHDFVYVWYNRNATVTADLNHSHQTLRRWTWNPTTKKFEAPYIVFEQREDNLEHNGAHIKFGPDGFLYFANGDDTIPDGDASLAPPAVATAQTLKNGLFSGMFRIDVDMNPAKSHAAPRMPTNATVTNYFIPNDNPFVGQAGVNEEYWALGFRNPYAFSFDKKTGDIYEGDVGDTFREEVNHIVKGHNYGWPIYEGTKRRRDGEPTVGLGYTPPLYEYLHTSIGSLVADMAGFVYRGPSMPELDGKYIFSDWPTARIWSLDTTTGKRTSLVETNWSYPSEYQENPAYAPVGFAQDEAGEVYLIAWSNIYKLVKSAAPHGVPLKLSETGIFRNTHTLKVPSSVVPYQIKSPLWSDAAQKQRWIYMPAGVSGQMDPAGNPVMPPGAILIKQFDLPDDAKPTNGRSKRLETRLMIQGTSTMYGVTYRWNPQGTDADLVFEAVEEQIGDENPDNSRTWHFPSQGECWSCHRAENRIMGFRGEQLNFPLADGQDSQLTTFINAGIFDSTAASAPPAIASPSDTTAPIEARATAYLAANCSQCHHKGASFLGGGDTWIATPGVALADRGLLNKQNSNEPMAIALGVPFGNLIQPGDPDHSILLQRLKTTDADVRMPPILRTKVDADGVALITQWIQSIQ